jgi:hypothetical protein
VEHYAPRPFALLDGRELSASSIRRGKIEMSAIHFVSTTDATLRIDGGPWEQIAIAHLSKRLSSMRRQTVELSLLNRARTGTAAASETYRIEFRIAEATALRRVEGAFRDYVNPQSLSLDSLRAFVDDCRCLGEGSDYAGALAGFVLGVLRKEDPSSKNLTTPSRLYRDDYVRAGDVLREIDRPLARLVVQLIRFGLNDFSAMPFDTGYAELDASCRLLHDPRNEIINAPRELGKFQVCPVDHDTSRLINLAVRMAGQERWSELLSNECRDVATSSEMEAVDQQKAYAIWAASAWRVRAFSEALEPLRMIAAIYPFDRWATPLLEDLL